MNALPVVVPLDRESARRLTDEVRADAATLWGKLLTLYEGGAHEALGYGSWADYFAAEFGQGSSQAYRILDAARVQRMLGQSPMGEQVTERVARELVPVMREDPVSLPAVMAEAEARAEGGPVTAAVVREVVAERRPSRITSGLMSSESDEWYTPRAVIERLLRMWPAIDLDPASNPGPVRNVPATHHHDISDSGLAARWSGRVFLNPPYGDALTDWAEKVVVEERNYDEAVVLVPARTETRWWHVLPADVVCFFKGRLSFFNGATGQTGPAPFPSAALYVGAHADRFAAAFADAGLVYRRVR